MLILGILFLLLTGLCWVGIAAVVRDSASRNLDIGRIQFYTSGLLVLIAAAVLLLKPLPEAGSLMNRVWLLIPLFFAGIINYIMLYLMKIGMRTGNPGAVWGIVQSAFVCPFTMGIVFFGVALTAPRVIGILLIVAGIALFSRDRSQRKSSGKNWLIPTCGAFLIGGLCQCFSNIPSYMTDIVVPPPVRILLVQGGTVSAFSAAFLFRKDKESKNRFQMIFKPVLALTAVQLLSLFFCFYRGLDLTARAGAGSIGYPLAQGSCIIFFMFYEKLRYRKKHPLTSWIALFVQCAGLFAISL